MKRTIGVIEYMQHAKRKLCNHDCTNCPLCNVPPIYCPISGELVESLRRYEFSWFEIEVDE